MRHIVDLDAFPIDDPNAPNGAALVETCREALAAKGLFTLDGFLRAEALAATLRPLPAQFDRESFRHERRHNIYFRDDVEGLAADHPALAKRATSNRTLCADQIGGSPLIALYEWPRFAAFLAAVMGKDALFPMADPLARVNVMTYGPGEALNWHFDRSEFTTTLLLEAPEAGGAFEYRTGLRTDEDPNHDGVAALLRGEDPLVERIALKPGALNVFKGRNTPHRVTPPRGAKRRTIAVFSFYETPGVVFSEAERLGFYGRAS